MLNSIHRIKHFITFILLTKLANTQRKKLKILCILHFLLLFSLQIENKKTNLIFISYLTNQPIFSYASFY